MKSESIAGNPRHLVTVPQAPNFIPHSIHSIRWLIARADQNGFNTVMRRVGKRIYLDLDSYYRWVDEQNLVGGETSRAAK